MTAQAKNVNSDEKMNIARHYAAEGPHATVAPVPTAASAERCLHSARDVDRHQAAVGLPTADRAHALDSSAHLQRQLSRLCPIENV